ncbi:hypothetical protein B0T10DRAFT_417493 [Thelonectria olida]|uniref:Uncharacterized protein n=1 Tax=Thelonectria olida TaxID=1576542 RepID=A0A9P8VT41_9HYPO|nr:hypothetical protein B0T10DRAFT_417493 [Thelonectria olida]
MSISNLSASLVTARAENTNALINAHIELSLFTKKVAPPPEYEAVGSHLAPKRVHEAQEGTRHVIARKLGVLFKGILPSTPCLIKAYGYRASQIIKNDKANPKGNPSHGIFASSIGADATTLWAAATSGKPAIACHLLACMLARPWTAPESISIWMEIIARRKDSVRAKLEEDGEIEAELAFALHQNFSRDDIAEWDASARAWLNVADSVMRKEQTQLQLILDNLTMEVNSTKATYESVTDAWTSSMLQIERLLEGNPLELNHGDIGIGLSSWHLYPDMLCLSRPKDIIEQNDKLFPKGGILTISLESSPEKASKSIYWSLPLAHLRYYGLPVRRYGTISTSERDRLTVEELLYTMTASFIQPWDNDTFSTDKVLQFVMILAVELHAAIFRVRVKPEDLLASEFPEDSKGNRSWFLLLARSALKYKPQLHQPRMRRLRNLGRMYCKTSSAIFQNIFNLRTYLAAARSQEDKIAVLREFVKKRLKQQGHYSFLITRRDENGQYEFATAYPEPRRGTSRGAEPQSCHQRWLWDCRHNVDRPYEWPDQLQQAFADRKRELAKSDEQIHTAENSAFTFQLSTESWEAEGYLLTGKSIILSKSDVFRESPQSRERTALMMKDFLIMTKPGQHGWVFQLVIGDIDDVALFRMASKPLVPGNDTRQVIHQLYKTPQAKTAAVLDELSVSEVFELFDPESRKVRFTVCAELLQKAGPNISWLGATFINDLYHDLDGATIDVRVVQKDWSTADWISSRSTINDELSLYYRVRPGYVDTAICFSCIAMMETGQFNLQAADLSKVFALSTTDSLHVVTALLNDPATKQPRTPIRRFTGNIGKAGVAFMIPPAAPNIREFGIDEWYRYDFKPFDGKMEDHFADTKLQLSFSEASFPLNVGYSGGKDVEAYFQETLVSVFDGGKWIAELDVLSTLRSEKIIFDLLSDQSDDVAGSLGAQPFHHPDGLVSIDTFDEMIVAPSKPGILRARGNWEARLAALCICIAKGYTVLLIPEDLSWDCDPALRPENRKIKDFIEFYGSMSFLII